MDLYVGGGYKRQAGSLFGRFDLVAVKDLVVAQEKYQQHRRSKACDALLLYRLSNTDTLLQICINSGIIGKCGAYRGIIFPV
jgi:hypothetical protein